MTTGYLDGLRDGDASSAGEAVRYPRAGGPPAPPDVRPPACRRAIVPATDDPYLPPAAEPTSGVPWPSGIGRRLALAVRALSGNAPDERRGRPAASPPSRRARFDALIGRLAAHGVHDVANHLQVVLGNAELLASSAVPVSPSERRLAWIGDAAREAVGVNAHLLALVRLGDAPDDAGGGMSLGEVLDGHGPLIAWSSGSARWRCAAEPDARDARPVESAPPTLLLELLLHLALLARERAAPGAAVTLHATLLERPRGTALRLRLSGSGPAASAAPAAGAESEASIAALAGFAGGRVESRDEGAGPADLAVAVPVERATASP